MQEYIERRVLQVADYILTTGATVRTAAKIFGMSKSTIHKDMAEIHQPGHLSGGAEGAYEEQGRAAHPRGLSHPQQV